MFAAALLRASWNNLGLCMMSYAFHLGASRHGLVHAIDAQVIAAEVKW